VTQSSSTLKGEIMAWSLSGRGLEMCSCKTFCPCWLTADVQPDEGWCASVFALECSEGVSDKGVNFAGAKFAMLADWPGNFHHGNGKARLYFDPTVSAEQQTAIKAIFEGGVEGPVPALWSAAISEWLTPAVSEVDINWDQNTVSIAGVGESTMTALTDGSGNPVHMHNSVSQVAIGIDRLNLMAPDGAPWADPDLHKWNAADGVNFEFSWAS
jgi:hypothetical protein